MPSPSAAGTPATDQAIDPAARIRFVGAGSTYAWIWATNAIGLLLTAGLLYPWTRTRSLRYLCASTRVGNADLGWQPLVFDGQPARMFPGHLLMTVVIATFLVANDQRTGLADATTVLWAWLIPLLVRSSLAYRCGQTRWRGIAFGFDGGIVAAWQVYLPAILAISLIPAWRWLGGSFDLPTGPELITSRRARFIISSLLLGFLIGTLIWRAPQYRFSFLRYGQLRLKLVLTRRPFNRYVLSATAVACLVLLGAGVLASVLGAALPLSVLTGGDRDGRFAFLILVALLCWALVFRPWLTASRQNLFWSSLQSADGRLRFHSRLPVIRYLGSQLGWGLCVVATLGLAWPFAKMALTRRRVEAISIETSIDLADVPAGPPSTATGLGDSAALTFRLGAAF